MSIERPPNRPEDQRPAAQAPPAVAPGDLFVLRETADYAVEWAIVARDARDPARLRAVPADTHPATGSADVRVPARAAAGPLNLRCAHAVWLPEDLLDLRLRSGALDPTDRALAERRLAEIESDRGIAGSSPLGVETDRDPEYIEWIAEVVAPAAEALRAAVAARPSNLRKPPAARARPARRFSFERLAAAALLAVALGLGWNTVLLRREIERLSKPSFGPQVSQIDLSVHRGLLPPIRVNVPAGATLLGLIADLGEGLSDEGIYHLELVELAGDKERVLWTGRPFKPDRSSNPLVAVSREIVPDGLYWLRLYRKGAAEIASERSLEIVTAPAESAPGGR